MVRCLDTQCDVKETGIISFPQDRKNMDMFKIPLDCRVFSSFRMAKSSLDDPVVNVRGFRGRDYAKCCS